MQGRTCLTTQPTVQHTTSSAFPLPTTSTSATPCVDAARLRYEPMHDKRQPHCCALPVAAVSHHASRAGTRNELTANKDDGIPTSRARAATSHGARRAGCAPKTPSRHCPEDLPSSRDVGHLATSSQQTTQPRQTSRHGMSSWQTSVGAVEGKKKRSHKRGSVGDEGRITGEHTTHGRSSVNKRELDARPTPTTLHGLVEEFGQSDCCTHSQFTREENRRSVEGLAECPRLAHEGNVSRRGDQMRISSSSFFQPTQQGVSGSLLTARSTSVSTDSRSSGTMAHAMESPGDCKASMVVSSQATLLVTPRSPAGHAALLQDARDKISPVALCRGGEGDTVTYSAQGHAVSIISHRRLPQRHGGSEVFVNLAGSYTTAESEGADQTTNTCLMSCSVHAHGMTYCYASPAKQQVDHNGVPPSAKSYSVTPSVQHTPALTSRVPLPSSAGVAQYSGMTTTNTMQENVKATVGSTPKQQKVSSRKGDRTSRGRGDAAVTAETRLGCERVSGARSQRRRELYAWNRFLQQQLDRGDAVEDAV